METVKIINHGMITIPAKLRKKFNFHEDMEFFIESNSSGMIQLIPLIDIKKEKEWYKKSSDVLKIIQRNQEIEIELENDLI